MAMIFTIQELSDLMMCLDVATKAGGLRIAEKALPLAKKIREQMSPVKPSTDAPVNKNKHGQT